MESISKMILKHVMATYAGGPETKSGWIVQPSGLIDELQKEFGKLQSQNQILREALEQVAQWDGDRTSIIPSKALAHYARMCRAALEKCKSNG